MSEKLDYTPGVFQVERHVRGKWVCRSCESLIQAPVPAQIIDKGIPTAGLLAHVLVSKYADHQPLYRLEGILERAEVRLPRSTLGQWSGACGVQLAALAQAMKSALLSRTVLHADETPVPMLKPGLGHTHQAYLWSYGSTQFDPMPAVVYDFAESRGGHHAERSSAPGPASSSAMTSPATRRSSSVASSRSVVWRTQGASSTNYTRTSAARSPRRRWCSSARSTTSRPERASSSSMQSAGSSCDSSVPDLSPITLRQWLILHRSKVPDGSATAKAIEYSLGRWEALIRYIDDGDLPIDNNWLENRIRPVALGQIQLALRRITARRPARRRHHESDPVR